MDTVRSAESWATYHGVECADFEFMDRPSGPDPECTLPPFPTAFEAFKRLTERDGYAGDDSSPNPALRGILESDLTEFPQLGRFFSFFESAYVQRVQMLED